VGLANWLRGKRPQDAVDGTFRVISVTPFTLDQGQVRLHISGVISAPDVPATAVQVKHQLDQNAPWPQPDTEYPARIDREKPDRYVVDWPDAQDPFAQETRAKARAEQVARAIRLGLDPSIVPPPSTGPVSMRELIAAGRDVKLGNQPLVDGSIPVNATEAEPIYAHGIPATATITGIDFLTVDPRVLKPIPGGAIAHVVLDVHRADGTSYQVLTRFGFKNAARVAQLGCVGAQVPVRIDPADERRVILDGPAIPY
jgi:hypothetical protein